MKSSTKTIDYIIDKKNHLYRIKANIVGSKLIHLTGFHSDYIEYYLKIETDYEKWTLKKRYDEFHKLNSKLVDLIPELKSYFPPKRLFKSSNNTVSERIKCFNRYLSYLFCNVNIFLIDEILNFISIKKEIIQLFIKKYYMLRVDEDNEVLISLNNAYERIKQKDEIKIQNERAKKNNQINNIINMAENKSDNYYDCLLDYELKRQSGFDWDEPNSQTPNLIVIKEFLINISEKLENNTEILRTFQNFLNKGMKWKRLTSKEILTLYIGEDGTSKIAEDTNEYLAKINYTNNKKKKKITSDFRFHSFIEFYEPNDYVVINGLEQEEYYSLNYENKINGLFFQIGNYNDNIILSVGAMDLLDKLLDTESNPDAEVFINIFKSCDIKYYKLLNLNKIIKNNIGGNKNNLKAMKLLKFIFNDKNIDEFKRNIIEDDLVYKQFINYINKFIE